MLRIWRQAISLNGAQKIKNSEGQTLELTYKHTLAASYGGYITQAAVNNLAPLLFTAFRRDLDISLTQLSALISVNFVTQIIVDALSVKLLDRIGLRRSVVLAHGASALGFLMLGILPFVMDSFTGLCIAIIFCAVGGGITEVTVSPIVEALPGDAKASAMSLLHSFYCWGQMGVVLLSTAYFSLAGTERWRYLPVIWALLPAANGLFFTKVPLCELLEEGEEPIGLRDLFKMGRFRLFLLLMICAGASELAMSQWSSYFAERGLNVTKTVGDLLGPCAFAVLMGSARLFYGLKGECIPIEKAIAASCGLCVISYLTAVFAPSPVLSLMGCGVCGLSVGMLWPGTFSIAARELPKGGNGMFAVLALAGDIGCAAGPAVVGLISDSTGELKSGILAASVFPAVMLASVACMGKRKI